MPDLRIDRILEITAVAVVLYLILSNAYGFSQVVSSVAGAYSSSVKALQGRG